MDDLGHLRPDVLRVTNISVRMRVEVIHPLFMNPKVKFKIDVQKDLQSLSAFVDQSVLDNGRSLRWAIFKKHPLLRKAIKDGKIIDQVFAEKYISATYQKNAKTAVKNMRRYERDWQKIEKVFFKMTDDIFHNSPWPTGKYIAYTTIWGMFPRFLSDKTFQVPMKYRRKQYIPVTIAHEMLHFRFYAYVEKHYPRYRDPERNFLLWHISEIFNILVINSPAWQKVFGIKNMPYPEHRKIIAKLREKYQEPSSFNIDRMIRDIHLCAKKLIREG